MHPDAVTLLFRAGFEEQPWIGHSVSVQTYCYGPVDDHPFDQFNKMMSEEVATKPGGTHGNTSKMVCPGVCQPAKKHVANKKARSEDRAFCPGEESNLHAHYGHMNLNHARLPIPPPGPDGENSQQESNRQLNP